MKKEQFHPLDEDNVVATLDFEDKTVDYSYYINPNFDINTGVPTFFENSLKPYIVWLLMSHFEQEPNSFTE